MVVWSIARQSEDTPREYQPDNVVSTDTSNVLDIKEKEKIRKKRRGHRTRGRIDR